MNDKNRISTREAAAMLGMGIEQMRTMMRSGELNIGFIAKNKGRSTYYIYKDRVEEERKNKNGLA